MARNYWRVSPAFWGDEKVAQWSDDAKILALYLLTCDHRTAEGLFRLPKGYIITDLGWTKERLQKPFETLIDEGFIEYDNRCCVMLIMNALEYQAPENDNQRKGAIRRISDLPETPLIQRLYERAQAIAPPFAESVWEAFRNSLESPSNPPAPSPAPSPTIGQNENEEHPSFAVFWDAYPRKVGKGGARKAFDQATKEVDPDTIVEAVREQVDHLMRNGKKYCPHPSTWLNRERWDDDIEGEETITDTDVAATCRLLNGDA